MHQDWICFKCLTKEKYRETLMFGSKKKDCFSQDLAKLTSKNLCAYSQKKKKEPVCLCATNEIGISHRILSVFLIHPRNKFPIDTRLILYSFFFCFATKGLVGRPLFTSCSQSRNNFSFHKSWVFQK